MKLTCWTKYSCKCQISLYLSCIFPISKSISYNSIALYTPNHRSNSALQLLFPPQKKIQLDMELTEFPRGRHTVHLWLGKVFCRLYTALTKKIGTQSQTWVDDSTVHNDWVIIFDIPMKYVKTTTNLQGLQHLSYGERMTDILGGTVSEATHLYSLNN